MTRNQAKRNGVQKSLQRRAQREDEERPREIKHCGLGIKQNWAQESLQRRPQRENEEGREIKHCGLGKIQQKHV